MTPDDKRERNWALLCLASFLCGMMVVFTLYATGPMP